MYTIPYFRHKKEAPDVDTSPKRKYNTLYPAIHKNKDYRKNRMISFSNIFSFFRPRKFTFRRHVWKPMKPVTLISL